MNPFRASLAILALVAALHFTDPLSGCAVAPPNNKPVEIADESAIIVWDSTSSTQHFIRRATFKSSAQDFGFLVPTPTKPELSESDDAAFVELARITAPRIEKKPRPSNPGCGIGCSSAAFKSESVGSVRVLDEKRVAGYDAVVLEADDAKALQAWLQKHGYEFSDTLRDWAEHYIKLKWKITAFKVAKQAGETPFVSTSSVRMSFKTDKPFFPYREPASPTAPTNSTGPGVQRLLRVFFIAVDRVDGTLAGKPWPGKTVWANEVKTEDREKLQSQLKLPLASSLRVTEFEDRSSPRPGNDDLFFARSTDQSNVERPPHIEYTSNLRPLYLASAFAGVGAIGVMLRRRIK